MNENNFKTHADETVFHEERATNDTSEYRQ